MRITFLLPRFPWHASGGYRVVYTYAGLLAERGHDVRVVHPRRLPPGGWPAPVGVMGVARRAAATLRDVVMRPGLQWADANPRVQMRFVPELSDSHVPDGDAVIATWWSTAEAAMRLSDAKGRRFHLIQGYEVWHGSKDRVDAAWRAPLHKIVIATWLHERALELGVPQSMLTHVPNAIALDVFGVQQPIADRPRRVAMQYSSAAFKGGEPGLEILHRVRDRVPGLHAVLFGVVPPPGRLPSWIEYVQNATPARLASDVYNASAAYLCASLSEGWHLPPAEAMACGCAVVSSDIGGVADYATDGRTALLYPAGDVAAGADRLTALLLDDGLRVALAQRGLEKIRSFSWRHSADLFEAVIGSGRPVSVDVRG